MTEEKDFIEIETEAEMKQQIRKLEKMVDHIQMILESDRDRMWMEILRLKIDMQKVKDKLNIA